MSRQRSVVGLVPGFLLCFLLLGHRVIAQETLDAGAFVRTVVRNHPSLKKADHLVQAAQFALKASGLQPNPTLTLAATAGDAGESSNVLTQSFEISGQPRLRKERAAASLQATVLQRETVTRTLQSKAYRAWLSLWKQHRVLELNRLRVLLLEEMSRVAIRRFEVGEIAENEALRVELAVAQAESDCTRAEAAFQSAEQAAKLLLAENWGRFEESATNPPEPRALLGKLELPTVLESAGVHPSIQSMASNLRAAQLGAKLVSKERAPNLNLSLYRSSVLRTGGVEQGVQLSVSWPVFDWGSIGNRSLQREAEAKAYQASIEETLLKNKQTVSDAWVRLQAARHNCQVLKKQAQRYEELARESRIGYDVGILTLTDVLQTESSYRQAGLELLQARARTFELELRILELTGLPFPPSFHQEEL